MTLGELWQQFYLHLKAKRRSKDTLRFYRNTERVFERFRAVQEFPERADSLRVTHLRDFLRHLETQGLTPGGVHAHARALRSLFNWAFREELLETNPVRRLEMPTVRRYRLPTVDAAQVTQLLKASKTLDQPYRDAAFILTLFDTGVRVLELVSLQAGDLRFEQGLLRVVGKGSKERFVPIGARALSAINTYLRRERRPAHAGVQHVFLGRNGLPLTTSGVSIRLNKLTGLLGLPRETCSPHTFRRGFAVEFLRNGGNVFTLQQILGHSNLEMTRRYVTFLDEDLKAAHLRFSPADRLGGR